MGHRHSVEFRRETVIGYSVSQRSRPTHHRQLGTVIFLAVNAQAPCVCAAIQSRNAGLPPSIGSATTQGQS